MNDGLLDRFGRLSNSEELRNMGVDGAKRIMNAAVAGDFSSEDLVVLMKAVPIFADMAVQAAKEITSTSGDLANVQGVAVDAQRRIAETTIRALETLLQNRRGDLARLEFARMLIQAQKDAMESIRKTNDTNNTTWQMKDWAIAGIVAAAAASLAAVATVVISKSAPVITAVAKKAIKSR
jgi:hypothetical protein